MRQWLQGAIVLLALTLLPAAPRAEDALVLLKTIDGALDTGSHVADLTDTKGAYRALRLKLVSGRVLLSNIVLGYAREPDHTERRRIELLAGERTREINPTPEGRFLTGITLAFERMAGGRALIEVYGRQSPEDAARDREPPAPLADQDPRPAKKKKKAARPKRAPREETAEPPPSPPAGGEDREAARAPSIETAPAPAMPPSPGIATAPKSEPTRTRSAALASPVACVVENTCTPVRVFFGTNRTREDLPRRIAFSWRNAGELSLGSAVVTVPRKVRRESGTITRPTWWDSYVLRVPPEGDPERHFVIVPNLFEVYSDEASFLGAVGRHREHAGDYKDHAFIYVHGYRVDFDYGLYRAAQMAYDLGSVRQEDGVIVPFGTAFLYSWPSAGALKDYAYDQENARLAVDHLRRFLELVIRKTGVAHVHLVAHSMGNVPLLNAMSQLGAETQGATVSQVILAAPDMGTHEFQELAGRIKPVAGGFTLYASSSDVAMEASRKVHKNVPRAGDVVDGKPAVAAGIDTIDISAITTCYFCFGHDEYVEQSALLNDIAMLMQRGIRPPETRTPAFRLQSEGALPFWRYQP